MGGKRKVEEVDNAGEGDLDHEEEDEFQRDAEGLSFYERQRLELYVAVKCFVSFFR